MATEIPASITTPDSIETRLGTLHFFDGFPDGATVQKVYDNLDFQRGTQVFLTAMPAASLSAMRAGLRSMGADDRTALITESLMDPRSLFLTGNTDTVYTALWLDTKGGPLVIEVPPNVLGLIDDFWFRYVTDMGNAGPDRGQGGKYLLLPPGYTGTVPDGYYVARSRTYGNLMIVRSFVENGDLQAVVEKTKGHLRVYPLAQAANPPPIHFVDISSRSFNTIHANDFTYFEEVDRVVQEEPLEATDPEVRGLLAAIGIRKGQPFAPDDRMRRILADAAAVGNATARAIAFSTRDRDAYLYQDSTWKTAFVGSDYEFSPGGVLDRDARTQFFYIATGITPAMTAKMVGKGSQYAYTEHDTDGHYLDGAKSYHLHLPPDIPARNFWSVIIYDPQTRSMLQTDQPHPTLGSQKRDLALNPDTSVDIYFGPQPPPGKASNWLQTVPGKGWFAVLRLYGPLEPWFDKSWRPGEVTLV